MAGKRSDQGEEQEKNSEFSVEEAFVRIEEIIRKLEDTKIPLADAIAYYTEGVKLLEESRNVLQDVEKQLITLQPKK